MDKINYEEIYDHCKAICPEMQSVIEYVRNISSSNKEIKNTVDRLKGGDMPAVKRYVELYMKKALMYSLAAAKQSGLPLDELFSEAVSVAAQRAVDLAEHNIKKVTLMSSMSSDIKTDFKNIYLNTMISHDMKYQNLKSAMTEKNLCSKRYVRLSLTIC